MPLSPDYNACMAELKERETLVNTGPNEWHCWLKNHPNAADFFYGRAFGELLLSVRPTGDTYSVILSIWSIDDGSVIMLGPVEPEEKALKRAERLKPIVESWDGWIPTEAQVELACKESGLYWNR